MTDRTADPGTCPMSPTDAFAVWQAGYRAGLVADPTQRPADAEGEALAHWNDGFRCGIKRRDLQAMQALRGPSA